MKNGRSVLFSFMVCACVNLPALAEGIHRVVGPEGRVTYSDQPSPPISSGSGKSAALDTSPNTPTAGANAGGASTLPFALRQINSRYPVTLYTTADCAPCNSGRNLLQARGIPYVEKTISTPQDAQAFQRLVGDASLPLLTIGSQHIKGYDDTQWTTYLDAAGYPQKSQLPSSYRRPAPTPLAAPVAQATPSAPAHTPTTAKSTQTPTSKAVPVQSPSSVPVVPPVTNPAGIRF